MQSTTLKPWRPLSEQDETPPNMGLTSDERRQTAIKSKILHDLETDVL